MQNPFRKAVEKESDHLLIEEVIDHHRPNEDEGHPNVATTILCGSIAGIVAKTAVAPAERVKMKFQTSPDKFTIIKAIQYGDKIFQRGGLLSLWKGHSTTIIRVAPYSGISYAAHDYAELKFKKYLHTDSLPFVYKFLAGSIGGASGTFLTYPLDVLRVRLALTPGSNWVNTIKKGGLFQGLSPTMMGM
jgi:solute carrier family 25 protein 42